MIVHPYYPKSQKIRDAFEQIDGQIDKLLKHIHELRVRRNTYTPINKLPCELLEEIMFLLRQEVLLGEEEFTYAWMYTSHVCQHWREVALGSSRLWGVIVIPPAGLHRMEEQLRRLRSAPVSIFQVASNCNDNDGEQTMTAWLDRVKSEQLTWVLRSYLGRIQGLQLIVDREQGDILMSELKVPAKGLKHLMIKGISVAHPVVPDDLFGGSAPDLQALHFEACSFPWETALFTHTLQELHILSPSTRMVPSQLQHLLSSLPLLRTLSLFDALPSSDDIPPIVWNELTVGQGPYRHLSLRKLIVQDKCSGIAHLFSQIHLNGATQLSIYHYHEDAQQFLDTVVYALFKLEPASEYLKTRFNLRMSMGLMQREYVAFTFSDPSDDVIWLEIYKPMTPEESVERHFQYCSAMTEKLLLDCLMHCTVRGRMKIWRSMFDKLSACPRLELLRMEGEGNGPISLVGQLVDRIPQCRVHKQEGKCDRSWRNRMDLSEDSESEAELSNEETEEDLEESTPRNGQPGGDADEVDAGGVSGILRGRLGASSAANKWEENKGEADGGEGRTDKDYWSLRDDIKPCKACSELGVSFFPALRKLILRRLDSRFWWTKDEERRRLHPLSEFLVRRIRCGLRIEEVHFDPDKRDFESEETIQKAFYELCGDYSPQVKILYGVDYEFTMEDHDD